MRSSFNSIRRFTYLLVGAAFAVVSLQAAGDTAVIKGSKAASMENCVAETNDMRRNHMDYLKHQRDETVHGGIRGAKFSLVDCVDCHASKDDDGNAAPVTDEGQFCQACHAYVAVSPACFQCHRTTPMQGKGSLGAVDLEQMQFQSLNASSLKEWHPVIHAGSESAR